MARLYRVGINRCVDVPEDVSKTLGGERYVPVIATVHGCNVCTTLVPGSGGQHRLFLNGKMRKAAGVDSGDIVGILLRRDLASREVLVPDELRKALKQNSRARKAFRAITPALRREFLRWVMNAKHPETRQRRIQKGIGVLLKRASKLR